MYDLQLHYIGDRLEGTFLYEEAWLQSICCFEKGYSDWRLPSWHEYISTGSIKSGSCVHSKDFGPKSLNGPKFMCCVVRDV